MPHAEQPKDEALEELARQVPGFLSGLVNLLPPGGHLELGEAFKVFELPFDKIQDPSTNGKPFQERVIWKGSWHIQMWWNADGIEEGRPVGHVRASGDGPQIVEAVFVSALAADIDSVAEILTALPDSSVVRLLIVPSHYLHLLWILEPGHEDRFFALETTLKRVAYYTEGELLEILRRLPPAIGVGREARLLREKLESEDMG